MSARVLNPAMMSEMGHRGTMGGGAQRVSPTKAALDRVRRDLFGPVDHAAARALAERELRAQSMLDAERWGFDFHLEQPRASGKYEWKQITTRDVVLEPYALRGMPYLRTHAPGTPRKIENGAESGAAKCWTRKRVAAAVVAANANSSPINTTGLRKTERTPPQEPRVPLIGDNTTNVAEENCDETCGTKKKFGTQAPTTPVLPAAARKQQSSITDFMKSRKRSNGSTKSIPELPEKIARNAGQIRS